MFNRTLTLETLTKSSKDILILCFLLSVVTRAAAQAGGAQVAATLPKIAPVEPLKPIYYQPGAPSITSIQPVTYVRWAKKLSAAYNGSAIELMQTDFPLTRENVLFRRFGNLHYERTDEGKFSYVILIPQTFSKREAVADFLEKVIKPRFPQSRIVDFKLGKRSN